MHSMTTQVQGVGPGQVGMSCQPHTHSLHILMLQHQGRPRPSPFHHHCEFPLLSLSVPHKLTVPQMEANLQGPGETTADHKLPAHCHLCGDKVCIHIYRCSHACTHRHVTIITTTIIITTTFIIIRAIIIIIRAIIIIITMTTTLVDAIIITIIFITSNLS